MNFAAAGDLREPETSPRLVPCWRLMPGRHGRQPSRASPLRSAGRLRSSAGVRRGPRPPRPPGL